MISSEEAEKIVEFRSMIRSDLLPKDKYRDDYYLVRWLRARNMDVEKAVEMLEKSIQWRREHGIDEMLAKGAEVPVQYRKIFCTAVLGNDEEGCLVILLPFGRFIHRILLDNEGMDTALIFNVIWIERILAIVRQCEIASRKKGLRIVKVVDMEHYSCKELTYGPSREFILQTNRIFDENYPEILKSCVIINTPRIFSIMWNMIKPFLSKATLSKVQIYGATGQDEETWKNVLRMDLKLNPERVPRRWGGTRVGDAFCSQDTLVWIDAPIQLTYFTEGEINFDGLKTDKVKARDRLVIEFPVDIAESEIRSDNPPTLHWRCRVESYDISFAILYIPKNKDDREIIVPESRVNSNEGIVKGSCVIATDGGNRVTGMYNLIFDNRYSYSRSKTVYYSVQVVNASEVDGRVNAVNVKQEKSDDKEKE